MKFPVTGWLQIIAGVLGTFGMLSSTRAFTYSDTDLLLIFRRDGFNDAEFNLGAISTYLNLASGSSVPVTNWSATDVKANFNNSFGGPTVPFAP